MLQWGHVTTVTFIHATNMAEEERERLHVVERLLCEMNNRPTTNGVDSRGGRPACAPTPPPRHTLIAACSIMPAVIPFRQEFDRGRGKEEEKGKKEWGEGGISPVVMVTHEESKPTEETCRRQPA